MCRADDSAGEQFVSFVDEMQAYLSDVMGEKGNEVSLAMYDIKLYNEKNYFPLKTSTVERESIPPQVLSTKVFRSSRRHRCLHRHLL